MERRKRKILRMKLNNKGWASRFTMLCMILILQFAGWMYMKHLATTGKLDPEIARVIEDPFGTAKEYVDEFNRKTQERMDSYNSYG